MRRRRFLFFGTLALGAFLLLGSGLRSQDVPNPPDNPAPTAENQTSNPDGVEVLTRGPVHEAFAELSIRSPRANPVITKKPPDPIEEMAPEEKPADENVQWISGYWAWDDERQDFLWVSGIWRIPPPGKVWTPGYWNQVDNGWQWVSGFWADQEQKEVEYLPEPPDPVAEAAPPAPESTDIYVPGCWVYNETRYMWRPGFWLGQRPGWVWVSSSYKWTPAGYIYVEGHWDYPLRERGMLFAPIVVASDYLTRPNWFYQPSYVVQDNFLMGALFVRLEANHYYFGDYFEPRYNRLGYTPWINYRISGRFQDPLFDYYRWDHRDNPEWSRDIRQVYVGRENGDIPRPPRTLVQQNTLIQNIHKTTINNTTVNNTTINNITNVSVVSSIKQINHTEIHLQPVTKVQMTEIRNQAVQTRKISVERHQADLHVSEQRHGPGSPSQPVRVEMPKVRVATIKPLEGTKAPPPLPHLPKAQVYSASPRNQTGQPIEGNRGNNPTDTTTPGEVNHHPNSSQPKAEMPTLPPPHGTTTETHRPGDPRPPVTIEPKKPPEPKRPPNQPLNNPGPQEPNLESGHPAAHDPRPAVKTESVTPHENHPAPPAIHEPKTGPVGSPNDHPVQLPVSKPLPKPSAQTNPQEIIHPPAPPKPAPSAERLVPLPEPKHPQEKPVPPAIKAPVNPPPEPRHETEKPMGPPPTVHTAPPPPPGPTHPAPSSPGKAGNDPSKDKKDK